MSEGLKDLDEKSLYRLFWRKEVTIKESKKENHQGGVGKSNQKAGERTSGFGNIEESSYRPSESRT